MNYIFITGSSNGIGAALVSELLKNESNLIYGYSRSNTIEHARFKHLATDLSDIQTLSHMSFPDIGSCRQVILVNNAGTLGDVAHVGNKDAKLTIDAINLNITAPMLLCNAFIAQYRELAAKKIILNIGSGAGSRAIDGWSTYCSSKAALSMLSETIALEQTQRSLRHPFKIHCISPGKVDTAMQNAIRDTNPEDFSTVDYFKDCHTNGSLKSPHTVAIQMANIIDGKHHSDEVTIQL